MEGFLPSKEVLDTRKACWEALFESVTEDTSESLSMDQLGVGSDTEESTDSSDDIEEDISTEDIDTAFDPEAEAVKLLPTIAARNKIDGPFRWCDTQTISVETTESSTDSVTTTMNTITNIRAIAVDEHGQALISQRRTRQSRQVKRDADGSITTKRKVHSRSRSIVMDPLIGRSCRWRSSSRDSESGIILRRRLSSGKVPSPKSRASQPFATVGQRHQWRPRMTSSPVRSVSATVAATIGGNEPPFNSIEDGTVLEAEPLAPSSVEELLDIPDVLYDGWSISFTREQLERSLELQHKINWHPSQLDDSYEMFWYRHATPEDEVLLAPGVDFLRPRKMSMLSGKRSL